jgi:hypothetical protein
MTTEQYSIGYEAGYQEGWNDAQKPQRTWVGLVDTDIGDEYVRFEIQGGFNRFEYAVRAIEAKLRSKNYD